VCHSASVVSRSSVAVFHQDLKDAEATWLVGKDTGEHEGEGKAKTTEDREQTTSRVVECKRRVPLSVTPGRRGGATRGSAPLPPHHRAGQTRRNPPPTVPPTVNGPMCFLLDALRRGLGERRTHGWSINLIYCVCCRVVMYSSHGRVFRWLYMHAITYSFKEDSITVVSDEQRCIDSNGG